MKADQVSIYKGDFARDFVDVNDVVNVLMLGLVYDVGGGNGNNIDTFNIGTGNATKLKAFVKMISDIRGIH